MKLKEEEEEKKEKNNEVLNELKEIRKKQYEDSCLLRKRKNTKLIEIKKVQKENIKDFNKSQSLLETKASINQINEEDISVINNSSNDSNDSSNNKNLAPEAKSDLANERRKNKGFESKDSKILHYLLIIYYNLKTLYTFIYMFFHSLISNLYELSNT
ncbi:hypothetical protein BCR36DRAFT_373888 [Piromyces finnis]|uniref:Uncharacterized protein n=1 Tax=Piromyces finnis TaxID=1754191 RepID=A0A1Y1UZV4_9FUNG|nr:hypothetical protein BCR36DRAFT_373888 [Piromyces finnis]|eukprot:ORX43390.1 hypothetical protein BCR36DRAFT_373888 [Piromyces finnis]